MSAERQVTILEWNWAMTRPPASPEQAILLHYITAISPARSGKAPVTASTGNMTFPTIMSTGSLERPTWTTTVAVAGTDRRWTIRSTALAMTPMGIFYP